MVKAQKSLAERGDVKAQLKIVQAAFDIDDNQTVLKVPRPLAEQGYAEAQTLLGKSYSAGDDGKQDTAEAMKWWRKAADQGARKHDGALARCTRLVRA